MVAAHMMTFAAAASNLFDCGTAIFDAPSVRERRLTDGTASSFGKPLLLRLGTHVVAQVRRGKT